jgi:hypothetical protein
LLDYTLARETKKSLPPRFFEIQKRTGGYQLPSSRRGGDNRSMPKNSQRNDNDNDNDRGVAARLPGHRPFVSGAMVVVTLGNPRDKFWGMIFSLAPEGLSVSGIELASFEDLVVLVKDREPFTPAVVFFPMHRIERIELDLPDGSLPSLSQRFSAKTGLNPATTFGSSLRSQTGDPTTKAAMNAGPQKKGPA